MSVCDMSETCLRRVLARLKRDSKMSCFEVHFSFSIKQNAMMSTTRLSNPLVSKSNQIAIRLKPEGTHLIGSQMWCSCDTEAFLIIEKSSVYGYKKFNLFATEAYQHI